MEKSEWTIIGILQWMLKEILQFVGCLSSPYGIDDKTYSPNHFWDENIYLYPLLLTVGNMSQAGQIPDINVNEWDSSHPYKLGH